MLNINKSVIRWSGLSPRPNHVGHLYGVAELVDAFGITLPGLTLQIEVKAPADVERCLYLFTIFQLRNRKRFRAYQLEVAPRSKRTHNGLTTIYGPHEHHWEEEPLPVTSEEVKCDNWEGALSWFFLRTSITPFEIKDPNHVEL